MYKTKLGSKGYTIYTKEHSSTVIDEIKKELTIAPNYIPGYGDAPEPMICYRMAKNGKKMFIPKIYGINKFGKPTTNTLTSNVMKIPENSRKFNGEERPIQTIIIQSSMKQLSNVGGVTICESCGGGKTFCAIKMFTLIGEKAMVVVNKKFLMEQWVERLKQFAPNARVGIIKQKRVDVANKDIVIAMLQSISTRDYPREIFKEFGVVFFDEVHLMPSKIFGQVFQKYSFDKMVGLSATPTRVDGMDVVYKMHIGSVLDFKPSATNQDAPKREKTIPLVLYKQHIINPPSPIDNEYREYSQNILNFKKKPLTTAMCSNIVKYSPRNLIIANDILTLYKLGRDIIAMTAIKKHIYTLKQLLIEKGIPECDIGVYHGNMKEEVLNESATKKIMLATRHMCSTGFDVPRLNTALFLTPMSKGSTLVQSCGRAQRKYNPAFPPLIVDYIDLFSNFEKKGKDRKKYYKSEEYVECNEDYSIPTIIPTKTKKTKKKEKTLDLTKEKECLFG